MHLYDVVNKQYPLSSTYVPASLVYDDRYKIWLCKDVYKAFYQVNQCMKRDKIEGLYLISGYRSYSYQQKLFNKKINQLIDLGLLSQDAEDKAATIVAKPGSSEHQTGLAMDVTAYSMKDWEDPLCEDFECTEQAQWMQKYAHRFGFILRYPKDKSYLTGIIYEPWHYRYVGTENANAMHTLGMCLEEYVPFKTLIK